MWHSLAAHFAVVAAVAVVEEAMGDHGMKTLAPVLAAVSEQVDKTLDWHSGLVPQP